MKRKKITPHKGGRTERIFVRATPETKQALEEIVETTNKSAADLVEEWVKQTQEEAAEAGQQGKAAGEQGA